MLKFWNKTTLLSLHITTSRICTAEHIVTKIISTKYLTHCYKVPIFDDVWCELRKVIEGNWIAMSLYLSGMLCKLTAQLAKRSYGSGKLSANQTCLLRDALTSWRVPPFVFTGVYSIFIPVQPFMSSTMLLPSSSAAVIGPNLIVREKVSSGVHFGSICKLLQHSMTSRNLTPEFQFEVRQRWLQCRWRIRKLAKPHSRSLHIRIMISLLMNFFLIYSIWMTCMMALSHHVICLIDQTSNRRVFV